VVLFQFSFSFFFPGLRYRRKREALVASRERRAFVA
jgi:hypothetical protein